MPLSCCIGCLSNIAHRRQFFSPQAPIVFMPKVLFNFVCGCRMVCVFWGGGGWQGGRIGEVVTTQHNFFLMTQCCWFWAWGQQHSEGPIMSPTDIHTKVVPCLWNLQFEVGLSCCDRFPSLQMTSFLSRAWPTDRIDLSEVRIWTCFLWNSLENVWGLKKVSPFPCMHIRVLWFSAMVRFESGGLVQKLRADCLLKFSSIIVRESVWIQLIFNFLTEHPVPGSPLFET